MDSFEIQRKHYLPIMRPPAFFSWLDLSFDPSPLQVLTFVLVDYERSKFNFSKRFEPRRIGVSCAMDWVTVESERLLLMTDVSTT